LQSIQLLYSKLSDDIKNLPKINNLPAFYRDIIMCWVKTGGQLPNSKHFANSRKQLIWGNKYIKVKGESLLYNNWIDCNLIYINDLLFNHWIVKQFVRKNINIHAFIIPYNFVFCDINCTAHRIFFRLDFNPFFW
jgi:hypothetical protein